MVDQGNQSGKHKEKYVWRLQKSDKMTRANKSQPRAHSVTILIIALFQSKRKSFITIRYDKFELAVGDFTSTDTKKRTLVTTVIKLCKMVVLNYGFCNAKFWLILCQYIIVIYLTYSQLAVASHFRNTINDIGYLSVAVCGSLQNEILHYILDISRT